MNLLLNPEISFVLKYCLHLVHLMPFVFRLIKMETTDKPVMVKALAVTSEESQKATWLFSDIPGN